MNRQQRSGAGTPGSLGASYASRLANNSPRSTHGDASVRNILSLKSPGGNKDWKSPTSSTLLASRTFTARLDPQVYTDTQSRGLTARLASYYERERLTTPIVNRLYNRAGEFPVVHFHKNELTNSMRTNQPGSSGGLGGQVRIPAPERTTYQSTMRSEILRTGATVGNGTVASVPLTGAACDDATVPNDTYELLAPLDALKEISRKRIHCDEAASNIDSVKKQRADDVASSEATAVAMAEAAETRKAQQYSAGNSKRPRDRTSPTYNSSGNVVKQKRPNTKNNDVLSSLSSSVRLAAAAAALRKQNQSLNNSTVLMAVEPATARPSQASFVEESSAKDTPESRNAESNTRECETPTYQRKSVVERPEPMVVQPARSHVHQSRFELSIPAETRPQLTLFNSVYHKQAANLLPTNVDQQNGTSATVSSSTANGKTVAGSDDDDDDNRRVSYVKPKASALDLQAPRVTGQTVKTGPQAKSKLALMLSCLSGDLDDDDQVDSSLVVAASKTDVAAVAVNQNASALKSEPIKASAISFGTGSTASAAKPSELSTPKPAVEKPTELEKPTTIAGDVTVTTSVVSSALPTPTFTFGSKTTQPAEPVSVQPVKPAASAEKKKGGFSFDPLAGVAKSPVSTSSLTTATATTTNNPSVPAAFTFGSGAAVVTTSNVTINTTTTTTSAVAPASVLSYEAKTTIGPAVAATSTTAPSLGGFSFGGVTTSASLAPTFGTLIPTKTMSVASSSAIPVLTFGSTAEVAATTAGQGATTTNSTTTATIANAAPATFSFGAASKIPVATFGSSAAAPSSVANLFANAQTAATTTAAATTTLSFGGTTAAAAAPVFGASAAGGVGSGTFSFGAVAATTTAAAAATPASPIASSTFGASVAKPSILANPTAAVQPTGASIFGTVTKGVPAFSASFAGTPATITTTAAAISFGDLNAAAPAVTTNSTQMFAFGSASTGSSTTFGMPIAAGTGNSNTDAVKAFAFGGGALSAAGSTTSVFGSAAAAPAPTFGTSAPALPVAPVVFGAAAATPVFGATSSAATSATPAFGSSLINSKAATATLPSFGSVATNNANATSVFGMAAAPVFGQSSNNNATAPTATVASSVFGSAVPQSAFGSSSNTTSFGGLSAAASAAVPSFGSSAAAPVPSMFGATPTTTAKPFGFGSNGSAPSFGAVTQQPQQQQQQQNSTFSFGNNSTLGAGSTAGTNTNAASPFSFGGSAAATNAINGSTPSAGSPFAFGAAAVPNVVTGSAPFGFGAAAAASKIPVAISTFGGAPTQAANPSAASPFSFGSSSGSAGPPSMGIVNPSSPFSFGGGSTIAAPTATPGGSGSGAFNFGGGAAAGVGTAPMGGMNLFSATSANGGGMSSSVKGRPIRQATRRINK